MGVFITTALIVIYDIRTVYEYWIKQNNNNENAEHLSLLRFYWIKHKRNILSLSYNNNGNVL